MKPSQTNEHPGSYFALPRLIRALLGEEVARAENNIAEAVVAGTIVLLIPCLAGIQLWALSDDRLCWLAAILLLPAIIPFWLLTLYACSVVIGFTRRCGLLHKIENRTIQHVLVWATIAAMSAFLAFSDSMLHWIGTAVFSLIAINLFAAVSLPLVPTAYHGSDAG
jgi:hypothetical protein